MTDRTKPKLVLASASAIRARMLSAAGIPFTVDTSSVDEAKIKTELRAQRLPAEAGAIELAAAKAQQVAARHADTLVLGADQLLERAGEWFDKPPNRDAARHQLKKLAGQHHRLISAAVVVENGKEVWRFAASATLQMRPLSDAYLDWYLDQVGDAVTSTVGAYQLERLGVQLFDRIEGDFFTILGLPLLPLLGFLRTRDIIPI